MPAKSKEIFNFFRRTFKSIFFGLNVITLLLLLSGYLSWYVSPADITIFAYIGLGFPFILIGCLFFIIFWLVFFNWKVLLMNILVMIICYPTITTYCPLNIKTEPTPENSIKILSYNVKAFDWNKRQKRWTAEDPLIKYLKSVDADIICMQEYVASRTNKEASTEKLLSLLAKYPYYSVIPLRSIGANLDYGLACFSKYPIKAILRIPVLTSTNGAALYKIEVNGKIISVINNHLESNRLTSQDKQLYFDFLKDVKEGTGNSHMLNEVKNNIEDRLGTAYQRRGPQVDVISHYIEEQTSDGIIVCGDFNDTPISYSYKTVCKNLVDSYTETGFGPGITYYENYFLFRIDFIMHSKNMKAYNFKVDKVKFSDHYPISTYLHFR